MLNLACLALLAALGSHPNTLSPSEKKAGWKLLFDGTSLSGWHNFRSEGTRAGWIVADDALTCQDPSNAGDIVTTDSYDWFELRLEYKISVGGNSGIMFHVTDDASTTWQTGPEIQLLDNKEGKDPQRAGWLYQIYDSPKDATRPAGEWNQVRIVIAPSKCEVDMNGVKYYDFVLGSPDFLERVSKSKFGKMPFFAKAATGKIALQGDHGQVSFRNVKVLPLNQVPKAAN